MGRIALCFVSLDRPLPSFFQGQISALPNLVFSGHHGERYYSHLRAGLSKAGLAKPLTIVQ